ncbi:hypothetical protein DMC18_10675, partial [Caulobacter sp. D5]|uniref:hypothetical protein n=2 Tax=unclassified Caulobacter TaxID=2648921 RepID=UPI000D9F4C8D
MSDHLSGDRAFMVLMMATGTGSVLTALMFAVLFGLPAMSWAIFMGTAVAALVVSGPVWCAGLFLLGGPCWWWLHRRGVRSRWAGAVAGAVLAGLTAAALVA